MADQNKDRPQGQNPGQPKSGQQSESDIPVSQTFYKHALLHGLSYTREDQSAKVFFHWPSGPTLNSVAAGAHSEKIGV